MEPSLWKSASTGCSELWQDFKKSIPPAAAQLPRAFPERTSYLGFDQLGRRWVFDLMANRLRAVISYDLAGPGKVNVRSLGQRERVATWT